MEFFKKIFSSKSKDYDKDEVEDIDQLTKMPVDEHFVFRFKENGGKFFYPEDMDSFASELLKLLKYLKKDRFSVIERSYLHFLEKLKVPCTTELTKDAVLLGGCESLIAEEGAVMTTSRQTKNFRNIDLPNTRVFIALSNQITLSKADALREINKKYEDYPSNIQTLSVFKKNKEGEVSENWFDTYLFLIEN